LSFSGEVWIGMAVAAESGANARPAGDLPSGGCR